MSMKSLLLFLAALPLLAVDGTVLNATTGMPQADVTINLVQPGAEGMKSLGLGKSGPDGTFKIDAEIPPGPALLQSSFKGVQYTQALPPGTPRSGVRITVYDSTNKQPDEMSTQHLILLEPTATELRIAETFYTKNQSNLTFSDDANGSIQLYLPPTVADGLKVTINSVGVPIQRPLERGRQAGAYKISYPLKPGETRMDLEYTLPASATFSGKVFSNTPPVKLVTADTVILSGDGIKELGQEPSTRARVYGFDGLSFKTDISGVGSLRTPQTEPLSAEESGQPKCCEVIPARLHKQKVLGVDTMYWVLGIAFAILGLGGAMLFRKGQA